MRPRVVYWNNIPAPYMVARFNALAERGRLDFEVWFNARTESDRSWDVNEDSWQFEYRYLPTLRLFGREFRWPAPVFGPRPDLIVSLYAEPVFVFGWCVAKLRGIKTGFRVLMTHDSWVRRGLLKNSLKRVMFGLADAIETPGDDGRNFAIRCGARDDRIYFATHAVSDCHDYTQADRMREGRDQLRESLKLLGTTYIYVGRLWWGKGLKCLIQAFKKLQESSDTQVSLLIVGDGVDRDMVEEYSRSKNVENVVFTGFKQGGELSQLYGASDVFVFPTLGDPYGIVVNEAMTCGLPVISSSAAGEISARVENGVNGYIFPVGEIEALAECMAEFVRKPGLSRVMGQASINRVKRHTPEQWAIDFERLVFDTIESART